MPTASDRFKTRLLARTAALAAMLLMLLLAPRTLRAIDEPAAPINPADYSAKVKVACVGDSITFGAGISNRGRDGYPAQLGRMLGDKWDVKNFGVSGATMVKKGDLPYEKQGAYKSAQAFNPDVVVIFLGTNDSKPQNWKYKDEYPVDYKAMIETFKKINPKVVVYCCLPVPAFKPDNYGIRGDVIENEVIPLVKQVAEETHSRTIDLHSALADHKDLFPDRVHPNVAGATLMAKAVYAALTGKEAPVQTPAKSEK